MYNVTSESATSHTIECNLGTYSRKQLNGEYKYRIQYYLEQPSKFFFL